MVPPEGWKLNSYILIGMNAASFNYILEGPETKGTFPNIVFETLPPLEKQGSGQLDFEAFTDLFASQLKEKYPGLKEFKRDFRQARDGTRYWRWEYEVWSQKGLIHQVVYIFENGKSMPMMRAVYTRSAKSGEEFDTPVEAAMETMQYSP